MYTVYIQRPKYYTVILSMVLIIRLCDMSHSKRIYFGAIREPLEPLKCWNQAPKKFSASMYSIKYTHCCSPQHNIIHFTMLKITGVCSVRAKDIHIFF